MNTTNDTETRNAVVSTGDSGNDKWVALTPNGHAFLTALIDPYTEPAFRLEIRPLHPDWRAAELYPNGDVPTNWRSRTPRGIRQWFTLTTAGIRSAAIHAHSLAKRYEVYVGVLPRVGRFGKQQDVSQAGWLWCDIDGGMDGVEGAYRLLRASDLPTPHMVVISGNGLHYYWRLAEVVDLPDVDARFRFKMLLKRLCNAIGGTSPEAHADSSRADVASILRVPGTLNNKRRDDPKPVVLDRFDPEAETFSLTWWRAHLPALPAPPPVDQTTVSTARACDRLLRWARKPFPQGKRHQDLVAAAAWLIRDQHIERSVALDLIAIKAAASPGIRPITRDELEGMIRWA